jgi:hypothetical protein
MTKAELCSLQQILTRESSAMMGEMVSVLSIRTTAQTRTEELLEVQV